MTLFPANPLRPRLPMAATAALVALLAGCGAPPLDPGTPRLLSPAEIQAEVDRSQSATSVRGATEARGAGLRARAAALRRMPDPASADPELMRRARALGATGA